MFFSTLGTTTYAARVGDGRLVWRIGMGKYSPGIATDRHYFFSLNGVLIAYWGQRTTEYGKKGPHLVRTRDVLEDELAAHGVAAPPERRAPHRPRSSAPCPHARAVRE